VKNQFDVFQFDFPERGAHPVVLISHPSLCQRASVVNALYCTSQRQSRTLKDHEVLLNGEDGFDWETFVDCSVIYLLDTSKLFGHRGRVSLERRRRIREKLRDVFRLAATD
jgi:mRNA-degrading endonuclease toxin of MazEF toxin-antitoxin module